MIKNLSLRRERGVSIVEIAVVLVILGIVLAAGIPNYQRWSRDQQVRSAAESVMTGLQKAKAAALRQNRNVTFWLVDAGGKSLTNKCAVAENGNAWVVAVGSPDSKCGANISDSSAPMIVDKQLASSNPNIAVVAEPNDAFRVTFNGLGQVVATNENTISSLEVDGGDEARNLRIEISNGGALRLCDPAVTSDQDNRKCKG